MFIDDIMLSIFYVFSINETDAINAINGTIITYGQVRYNYVAHISL